MQKLPQKLQDKDRQYWRKVKATERRNHAAKDVEVGVCDLAEGGEGLAVPVDTGKPGEEDAYDEDRCVDRDKGGKGLGNQHSRTTHGRLDR